MYQLQTQTPALTPVPLNRQSIKSAPSTHHDSPVGVRLTPIAPMLPQTENPQNKSRRRGVVLTEQGWQKLVRAEVVYDDFGRRYTFEELSEWTLLDPRTVCRIVGRKVGVDKRSLTIFFKAFDLQLEQSDCTVLPLDKQDKSKRVKTVEEPFSSSVLPNSDEELTNLKQQIIANCQRLAVLSGFNENSQITLTVKSPQDRPQLEISLCQQYHLNLSSSN